MTKAFLALLLSGAWALAGSAAARDPLPPTDEAAAAAVRTQLAGKVWSGRATVGDNTADIEITLAASGRSGLGVPTVDHVVKPLRRVVRQHLSACACADRNN